MENSYSNNQWVDNVLVKYDSEITKWIKVFADYFIVMLALIVLMDATAHVHFKPIPTIFLVIFWSIYAWACYAIARKHIKG